MSTDRILRKIKAIALGAGVITLGGLGTYLTTDVNYVEAFGPGAGAIVVATVGFVVKEGFGNIIAYLKARPEYEVELEDDGEEAVIR